jgi:hypothetical protein
MLPSMRAQRNKQAIYTGTVPGPEINNPEHWRVCVIVGCGRVESVGVAGVVAEGFG